MAYAHLNAETREIAERILTRKQLDVFKLWCAGTSDNRIALMLDLHPSTVRSHRVRAIQKIKIETERQAA